MNLEEAIDKLVAQGSAAQIALYLEEQGVVGDIAKSESCAVARYIQRTTGATHVLAGTSGVSIREDGVVGIVEEISFWVADGSWDEIPKYVEIPEYAEIGRFVDDFDRGKYPNLIRRTS